MNAALFTKPARALILASGLIAASGVVGSAADVTVPLGTLANDPMTNAYLTPPAGKALLAGHTFDLTSGNMIPLAGGQSASLTGAYPNAKAAYVLINSYTTYLQYAGATIGTIVLTFGDGTTQTANLVVGTNVREWRPVGSNTVNAATGPGWSNAWTGMAQPTAGGGTAVIDMVTITVTGTGKTLTGIKITNQDLTGIGLIVPGVTVDDAPVVLPTPTPTATKDDDKNEVHKVKPPVHHGTGDSDKHTKPTSKPKPAKPADKDKGDNDKNDQTNKGGSHESHGDD